MTDQNEELSNVVGVPGTSVEERTPGALNNSVVVVKPEDDIKLVEEEVPKEVIEAKTRYHMPEDTKVDYTSELKGMVGSQFDSVKDYLDKLKESKIIATYRVVPIGMSTTLELEPGRVTVVTDSTKKIIDIQIS